MSAKIKAGLKHLLSQEQGAVVREWGARFPVVLVYPQVYPVAMGNLGFQAMYHLPWATRNSSANGLPPTRRSADEHRRTRTPILSLQSQRPLTDLPRWPSPSPFRPTTPTCWTFWPGPAFRLRSPTGPGDPLVLAGGVATFLNPEPPASLCGRLSSWAGGSRRDALLRAFSRRLPGPGPPRFPPGPGPHRLRRLRARAYFPRYHPDGTLEALRPRLVSPAAWSCPTWRSWPPTLPTATSWPPRASGARCF